MTPRRERTSFRGSLGDRLDARLDLPAADPVAYALFAHCFTCSKDVAAASAISHGLVDRGIGVLRFDFTGLGSSDGEFANTDFSSNVEDLIHAADMLRSEHAAPTILVGHSLGGAAILAAAAHIPESRAVVTIGAPFDPAHVTGLFPDDVLSAIRDDGLATVSLAGRRFTVRRQFLEDLDGQRMAAAIEGLARPLLVLHSPVDEVVDVDNARRIFETARHPKSFVSLDAADHLLTDRDDGGYAAQVLAAWASRYITEDAGRSAPSAGSASSSEDPGIVRVAERPGWALAQDITVRGHHLVADEPLGVGDDTGPTPYDLLLAGLGTCTSMTLRMYAERAGIPLEHVEVEMVHSRSHSTDCADTAATTSRLERIDRVLHLHGDDLQDEHIAKLRRIADRCPVHRTLESDLCVTTTVSSALRPTERPSEL